MTPELLSSISQYPLVAIVLLVIYFSWREFSNFLTLQREKWEQHSSQQLVKFETMSAEWFANMQEMSAQWNASLRRERESRDLCLRDISTAISNMHMSMEMHNAECRDRYDKLMRLKKIELGTGPLSECGITLGENEV